MNRILFEGAERGADGIVRFGGARAVHVASVLRAPPGATVRMGEIGGARHDSATLVDVSPAMCSALPGPPSPALPRNPADLLLALPRPKCLRRILPQIAALGPAHVFLTAAEKVEKSYWGSTLLEPSKCREQMLDGLAQAGDTVLPHIHLVRRLKPFVQDELPTRYPTPGSRLLAHPDGRTVPEPPASPVATPAPARFLIAVGPEGGWSPFELALFQEVGFSRVSLGPRTLRTDTAVVSLLALAAAGALRP